MIMLAFFENCFEFFFYQSNLTPSNKRVFFFAFRILFVCHGVMYQQLSAWVLHGIHIKKINTVSSSSRK